MKKQTTMKAIVNNWKNVYETGYCDLQFIFKYEEPQYYNNGIYGWNCDIYTDAIRDIAITTGYRNMRGKMIPRELIEKYSNIAKEIMDYRNKSYQQVMDELNANKENFLDELLNI